MVSFLSIGTIAVSVLIFNLFLMVFLNLEQVAHRWKGKLQMTVYLEEDLDEEVLSSLVHRIEEMKEVEKAIYISPEEAMRILKERLGDHAYILEGLQENPLPPSVELNLRPPYRNYREMVRLRNVLSHLEGVEEVDFGEQWVKKLGFLFLLLKVVGFASGGFLLVASMLVVANTIRLIMATRREEIEIMKLVGATSTFIRAPYYLEGMIYGLVGTSISLGVLYLLHRLILNQWAPVASYLGLPYPQFLPLHIVLMVLVGSALLGFLGSAISVRRLEAT